MTTHFLLSCSISANVRQSVQIKFKDLNLPQSVIDTLEGSNAVSLRPNLSNALKEELDNLRLLQRELYDSYCIHFGDNHFLTATYFSEAKKQLAYIKQQAAEANRKLAGLWAAEFGRWKETAEGILRPLFQDEESYLLAVDAYMHIFPGRDSYQEAISVYILGPLPTSLKKVESPDDASNVSAVLEYENYINTAVVLEAAKANAADKALAIGAELIDDLDCRSSSKVGKQQTGSDKKRGSWEVTANKLKLIADSVSGFDKLAELAESLLATGKEMSADAAAIPSSATKRMRATEKFYSLQEEIRAELETICSTRDSTQGLEKLKHSLALSTEYAALCERIKNAENVGVLNFLAPKVALEIDIYEQRGKKLRKLLAQRKELISCASGDGIDNLLNEIQEADF